MGQIIQMIRSLVCWIIRFYQYVISPCLRPSCRFSPSCSHYALQAIEHYGVLKGSVLSAYRLLRCHPWSSGGYDPLKEKI